MTESVEQQQVCQPVEGSEPAQVAAFVVALRPSERLAECLRSLTATLGSVHLSVVCVLQEEELAGGADRAGLAKEVAGVVYARVGANLGWSGGLAFARSLVDADYFWLVQDDMLVDSHCLESLLARLTADSALGAVRPLVVDERGLVPAGSFGGVLGPDGRMVEWFPREAVPPAQAALSDDLSYLASSGMLVRREAWDEVGGYDPAFYPVLWADVDFCRGLAAHGWGFGLVADARASHQRNASTPRLLGEFLHERNQELFCRKWSFPERAARFPSGAGWVEVNAAVDPSLVAGVARWASFTLTDFARWAHERDRDLREQAEQSAARAASAEAERDRLAAVSAAAQADLAAAKAALTEEQARAAGLSRLLDRQDQELKTAHRLLAERPADRALRVARRIWRRTTTSGR